MNLTIEDRIRFWMFVDRGADDECWLFPTGNSKRKYGTFKIKGKTHLAHRVAYRMEYGHFDYSLLVCHTCDVPNCVNPYHLFLGTHADNMRDCRSKGRTSWGVANANSILTGDEVDLIRTYLDKGSSEASLAEAFNVSRRCISHIAKKDRWQRLL